MAIAEGRAWLEARPTAPMAPDRVAGAFFYHGAHLDGAGYGDIPMAISVSSDKESFIVELKLSPQYSAA